MTNMKINTSRLTALLIAIICVSGLNFSQIFAKNNESIIRQKDKRTDKQKLLGEEAAPVLSDKDKIYLPGGDSVPHFTPAQDSMYYRAMRAKIPQFTRFLMELQETSNEKVFREAVANTPWTIAMKNLAMIPQSAYAPDPVERTMYETNIEQAFYVPFVPTLMKSGLKVPLRSIGMFLGIVDDVRPTISYELDVQSDVEVVVYSLQATVVQVIYKGTQKAGKYSYTWNIRDSKGKLMPSGDYVMEVRIGKYRFERKRIVVG